MSIVNQVPSLADLPLNSWATLDAPLLDPAHIRRLAELGLRAGATVLVLLATAGGGRVIAVGDSRIALDKSTLRRMPVRANGADPQ